MSIPSRSQTIRVLRALVRALVEEAESLHEPVNPSDIATRALFGCWASISELPESRNLRQEIEDYVRDLRSGESNHAA